MDSNNDGIGDLQGIISKIPYLKDLGITAIWLSPIYPSPQADFGYDVADYIDIDPIFGTLKDFDELVQKAHDNHIKVMLDYVPNHTSSHHSWFRKSRSSKDNDKRDWYIWADPKPDGTAPNNWLSHFGGPAWTLDKTTNQYYLHLFDKAQPDLNWRNPAVVKAMLDVLRFWMDRGVDGFRVDVPYVIYKDPLLSDEPPNPNYTEGTHSEFDRLLHTKTLWLPEVYILMKKFVSVLKEYEGKFMVTETWTDLAGLVKTYTAAGWKYFQPFNFSLITLPWRADVHKKYIDEYETALGELYIPCWVLGNHDRSRVATRIDAKQARVAALLQLSLRGFPFIYNGEEIGMTDGKISHDEVVDPYEKLSPGLGLGRDPERTPMQWDDTQYAGFSTHKPWLPVADSYKKTNVKEETNDPSSMLSLYKKLISLRKENRILEDGAYVPLPIPSENVYAFVRDLDDKRLLVLINFDGKNKTISFKNMHGKILCDTQLTKVGEKISLSNFILPGDSGMIVQLDE